MEDENMFQVLSDYLIIRMPEEVDHHVAGPIGKEADKFIVSTNLRGIVFDFEKTKFMDSSGLGIIYGRYKNISCFGGKVYAINTNRQIDKILNMSRICGGLEL